MLEVRKAVRKMIPVVGQLVENTARQNKIYRISLVDRSVNIAFLEYWNKATGSWMPASTTMKLDSTGNSLGEVDPFTLMNCPWMPYTGPMPVASPTPSGLAAWLPQPQQLAPNKDVYVRFYGSSNWRMLGTMPENQVKDAMKKAIQADPHLCPEPAVCPPGQKPGNPFKSG